MHKATQNCTGTLVACAVRTGNYRQIPQLDLRSTRYNNELKKKHFNPAAKKPITN
jgi:hypothetical protein